MTSHQSFGTFNVPQSDLEKHLRAIQGMPTDNQLYWDNPFEASVLKKHYSHEKFIYDLHRSQRLRLLRQVQAVHTLESRREEGKGLFLDSPSPQNLVIRISVC